MSPEQKAELDERIQRRERALVFLQFRVPHVYARRAVEQGFPPDVDPAELARHEEATLMQVELLEDEASSPVGGAR